MNRVRRFILLGSWAAGLCGVAGAYMLIAAAFSASPAHADYVSSLRSLGIAPAALILWLALPSLCVALGAAVTVLSARRGWLHLVGEALLLIAIVANVGLGGLGWYTVTGAAWLVIALLGAAVVLSIGVGVAFVVGEINAEPATAGTVREQENIHGN